MVKVAQLVLIFLIISIGRDKDAWISAGCEHLSQTTLSRYARVEFEYLPP